MPSAAHALVVATPAFEDLVTRLQHATGTILSLELLDERPLHGTTLFIAKGELETPFGLFRAYVFQDVIDKHYIVPLEPSTATKS